MDGVFLYDEDCRPCARSAQWLERHAAGTARVEAWQHADLTTLGLSAEECTEALQWVGNGRRAVGPDAVAAYLRTSTHSWQTAGRVLTAPVSQHLAWPVYRWVSHHTGHLTGAASKGQVARAPQPVKGVRRRRSKDLDACVHLLGLVFSEGQYPLSWPDAPRAWLGGDDVMDAWVLERQGEILGHVAVSPVGLDPRTALRWREVTGHEPSGLAGVTRLFVRPRVRGQGIGKALLDVAVADIRARGLVPVLDVVSASRDAIRLYEDQGWRLRATYPWGERPDLQLCFYTAPPPTSSR
jgi:GNAT superfamily N-acetyltransferase/predicted DCC family thiol-disulfide oxidoreductase YuxK